MNHIFQASVLLIRDNRMHNVTYLKGQKQPTIHSCTELNETQIFSVSIVKRNCLNKNEKNNQIFLKKKYIFYAFWIYMPVLVVSFINLIHKVWVDLINKRQQETHGLLGIKKLIPWNKPITGQWVHPENYNYLNPTQLLDLCCSVLQLMPLDCGSSTR